MCPPNCVRTAVLDRESASKDHGHGRECNKTGKILHVGYRGMKEGGLEGRFKVGGLLYADVAPTHLNPGQIGG
jgi:hypothetical protein